MSWRLSEEESVVGVGESGFVEEKKDLRTMLKCHTPTEKQ